jgi:hypothetical protein
MKKIKFIIPLLILTNSLSSFASNICFLEINSYSANSRRIEFSFNGGTKKDYKGSHIVEDNDGVITAHLIFQDIFRLKFPEGLKKNSKKNLKLFKIRKDRENILINSLKDIYKYNLKQLIPEILKVQKIGGNKDVKFYANQLDHLKIITTNLLEVIQAVDSSKKSKIKFETFIQIGKVLEEHLVYTKNNKSILNRTYDSPASLCLGIYSYTYGEDTQRKNCKTELNPIGFPFNSMDLSTGLEKKPQNIYGKKSKNKLSCTQYKVRIKDNALANMK